MTLTIASGAVRGEVTILPSKSHLHRLLICAALADKESLLQSEKTKAEDILATLRCLRALGARVEETEEGILVTPIDRENLPKSCLLDCGESGSTLRFLLPIVAALGIEGQFHMAGRLPDRPLSPLDKELEAHGCILHRPQREILTSSGKLTSGAFILPGNVSSQYITGLLLALPLLAGDSSLTITGEIESVDYIRMTQEAQKVFGLNLPENLTEIKIPGGMPYKSPDAIPVEGDWSNAAFWLCAGALPEGNVTCKGLDKDSLQGDKAVVSLLESMGAAVSVAEAAVTVSQGARRAITIDAAPIPDLICAISAVAAVAQGETVICQAGRLRLKESDRLTAIETTINALGGEASQQGDQLLIIGKKQLKGGTVDSFGDHRIAMLAAILSATCKEPVTVENAEAVGKSYPDFWEKLAQLGKTIHKEDVP